MAAELKDHFWKEVATFKSPPPREVAPIPQVGEEARQHPDSKLKLPKDKPTVIVFLRHCGCPFAEKAFRALAAFSTRHAGAIHCVAVSHSAPGATDAWLAQVGGAWDVEVVVDPERDVYAAWGLGLASPYWHAVGPRSLYGALQLGRREGIWTRTAESGTKWQTGGAFAVDRAGAVRWAAVARSASDVPDLDAALRALLEAPIEVP